MFFQRIFDRKSISDNGCTNNNESVIFDISSMTVGIDDNTDKNNNQSNNCGESLVSVCDNKMQRRPELTVGSVQLTPLWEHVLRTRRLPEAICPATMYGEFHERLQDPEWQVRQHALRVLVDVLVVMKSKADKHSMHFLGDLIQNLGHQAPTVRKGSLDCLRVYLSETDMPEMVMLQILDTGLNQQSTFDERLSCGVMLSLPALLQSILHTPQCHFIVKDTIERLMHCLQRQQNQLEITLKVLDKISELLGSEKFERYLVDVEGNDALALYKHLCKVYLISNKSRAENTITSGNVGAWRALPREYTWRNNNISQEVEPTSLPEKGKVIMETEIKINDDTLTMRILEAETETEETDSPIGDKTELVCRPLLSASSQRDMNAGILQIISDSEIEEIADPSSQNEMIMSTPFRSLKRVTFGGEVVKMRTPDSDAASSANNIENIVSDHNRHSDTSISMDKTLSLPSSEAQEKTENIVSSANDSGMTELTLEIPIDNTKPLPRARSAQSPQRSNSVQNETIATISNLTTNNCYNTSPKRDISHSPAFRCRSISPTGSSNVSPKVPHKEIEVLHNLQRDSASSPRSLRRSDCITRDAVIPSPIAIPGMSADPPSTPNTWEDLYIVSYKTITDLQSGDWRNRLQGLTQLEIALSSSANLVRVQPYLDSLLRTLLSSERNLRVAELKHELIVNLISRLPLDNLEDRTQQILSGLCRQGNAGANRVCKALMQRLPAGTIVSKLTAPEYLHAKSSKFRDHALQMSIYALMAFPGTCFDINVLTLQVTYAALNRKRRVRQAALEVLAVLADISSGNEVLSIVEEIAAGIESGPALLMAVKKRLSRPQLPNITADGAVLYIFHKPDQTDSSCFGEDVDWITQGEGSASPNSVKRRHIANKNRIIQNSIEAETGSGLSHSFHTDENLPRHSFHSPPEALDMSRTSHDFSQKKNYCTSGNFMDRRMVIQAYSESSVDGRSTDSTTTTCSSGSGSGNGSFIQLTPCNAAINRRLVRQSSRFPVMRQHSDFISHFMRNVQQSPYPYSFNNSKYSKINYVPHKTEKQQGPKKTPTSQNFISQQNWMTNVSQSQINVKVNEAIKQDSSHVIGTAHKATRDVTSTAKTKIQVEPVTEIGTTTSIQLMAAGSEPGHVIKHNEDGSPLSVKSTSYSQKSTASAKSNSSHSDVGKQHANQSFSRNDMEPISLEQQFGDLIVNDVEDETDSPAQEPILKRNESVNSLHSKTESIKTQMEDTTPQMSRAQSIKSLAIEEEIESSNSFVVVEELQHELESTAALSPVKLLTKLTEENEITAMAELRASSSSKSASVPDDRVIHSRSISLDSLYGGRPASKQGSLDTSICTTDNSSHTGSRIENIKIPAKVQHTPLKQKSKTSYFLRGQRRVSPVKQTIKMSQTELFPPNMSRFEKPREALNKTFDQLDSSNWEVNVTGLKCMVRLIRYHADFLDNHMHMTCIQLTGSVRNLRSQVARAACQAGSELFTLKCKSLEVECDDLVCALLHRTADTNRFLRADATRALESMVDHLQPPKVLNILTTKGAQHQNALVRTTTAKLLFRLVERLGSDRVYAMARESRDKFFMVGANLLLEGSLETRSYAKSMFRTLSEHTSYQRMLLEVIPPRTYRNVEKTLRSIAR